MFRCGMHTDVYFTYIHIPPLGGSMRVAYNDSDDRAGLRGYVQFNKYIHSYIHTCVGHNIVNAVN